MPASSTTPAKWRVTATGSLRPSPPNCHLDEPVSDRVLVTDELPVELLLSVLAGSGSLVLCRHQVATALARRAATERITKCAA